VWETNEDESHEKDLVMNNQRAQRESGYTILQLAVVVLMTGTVVAIATPKITNAMREYRGNIALRHIVDTMNRAKMQAISENKRSAMMIDTANNRAGMAVLKYDTPTATWIVDQTYYISLPQGVTFQRPSAAPGGVTSTGVTSFAPVAGSTTLYRQDFNSRGFPIVANGSDVASIFIGNGQSYRAITMTSVGGIRTYRTDTPTSSWIDTRY
jgi:Tfp pilus assembly protein FimT